MCNLLYLIFDNNGKYMDLDYWIFFHFCPAPSFLEFCTKKINYGEITLLIKVTFIIKKVKTIEKFFIYFPFLDEIVGPGEFT